MDVAALLDLATLNSTLFKPPRATLPSRTIKRGSANAGTKLRGKSAQRTSGSADLRDELDVTPGQIDRLAIAAPPLIIVSNVEGGVLLEIGNLIACWRLSC